MSTSSEKVTGFERTTKYIVKVIADTIGRVFTSLGVPGFVIGILVWVINKFSDADQKTEIINTYVLLEDKEGLPYYFTKCVIFFIVIFIIQWWFYRNKVRNLEEEISKCSERKRKLQDKLSNGRKYKKTKK